MDFFKDIYGVLFRPDDTFRYFGTIYHSKKLKLLVEAVLAYILATLTANHLSTESLIGSFSNWLLVYSVIFLAGFIFKLKIQDYPKLLTLAAFASLPMMFLAPVSLIQDFNPALGGILRFIVLLWSFNLNILVVSQVCQISKAKVLLLYALPMIIIVLVLFNLLISSIESLKIFLV
jgi:hypothetical protein